MTILVHVGRRIPRSWFRRQAHLAAGLLTFQENIWQMIKMSLQQAKRKANESGKVNFVITHSLEIEDVHYQIEWLKLIIKGDKDAEEDEYKDTLNFYAPLGKLLRKDLKESGNIKNALRKQFRTRMIDMAKVNEAYERGYGSAASTNISSALLEMGIMTHVEWIKDYDTR